MPTAHTPPPLPTLLSVTQAAAVLGVHPDTLVRWTHEGKIAYLRTAGGHRRFHRADVEAAREKMQRPEVVNGE